MVLMINIILVVYTFSYNLETWTNQDICLWIVPHEAHFSPLNAELNPICHFLVLLGAHPILHFSRIRVIIELSIHIRSIGKEI